MAGALAHACDRTDSLDVPEDWQEAVHRVVAEETKALREWQEADARIELAEEVVDWVKLAVKLLGAVATGVQTVGGGVLRVVARAASGLLPELELKQLTKFVDDLGGLLDKLVGVIDLVAVRSMVLAARLNQMARVRSWAPWRIKRLYWD